MLVKNPQPCYFIAIQEEENRVAGDVSKLLNCPLNIRVLDHALGIIFWIGMLIHNDNLGEYLGSREIASTEHYIYCWCI